MLSSLGSEEVVEEVIQRMKEVWELSKPEWIGEDQPVRFLGEWMICGEETMDSFISQEAYIRDVLKRRGGEEGAMSGIPITRDQAQRIDEPQEVPPTLEEVREAQKNHG